MNIIVSRILTRSSTLGKLPFYVKKWSLFVSCYSCCLVKAGAGDLFFGYFIVFATCLNPKKIVRMSKRVCACV